MASAVMLWSRVTWPRPVRSLDLDERFASSMLARFGRAAASEPRLVTLAKGSNSQSWALDESHGQRLVLRCALGNDDRPALEAMAGAATALAAAGVTTKTPIRTEGGSYTAIDGNGRPWQCWTWLVGRQPRGSTTEAGMMGTTLQSFHRALTEWLQGGLPAHDPYWPEQFDRSDVLKAVRSLGVPPVAGTSAQEIASKAFEFVIDSARLDRTAGHGDCHTDNFLIVGGGNGAALFDLELIGTRPGAQLTDLGVLMHRIARLAANRAGTYNGCVARMGAVAAVALAKSYGAGIDAVKIALGCAFQESLAKMIGCARRGPPGLDPAGRRLIAANHCLYLGELLVLRGEIETGLA